MSDKLAESKLWHQKTTHWDLNPKSSFFVRTILLGNLSGELQPAMRGAFWTAVTVEKIVWSHGKCVSASVRVKIDFYRRFFINPFDDLHKGTICIMKTLLYFVLFSFWLTWERARKLCCIFIKEGW